MNLSKTYHQVALMLFIAAFLYLLGVILLGTSYFMIMLFGFILCSAIGFGMLREWRWIAYIAFVGTIIGAILAFGYGMNTLGLTKVIFFAITFTDLFATLLTFGILWRSKPTTYA